MKRLEIISVATILVASAGLLGFGITQTMEGRTTFATGGYVLSGDTGDIKQLAFGSDTVYSLTHDQQVRFTDVDGGENQVSQDSFVFLDDGSIMALTGGVLFDFNDLSNNFINNYYISAQLPLLPNDGTYIAETTSGTVEFGENLWKLSEYRYLIQSPSLSVCFAEEDVREVSDFIQVTTTTDGIVQLLTSENRWVTISDTCYIETAGGVKIYPVTQLVDDGTYKMSLAKLSVSPDESIVLTEDETRRQIVPELNIEGVDGESGESGENGINGVDGIMGEVGQVGVDGEVGVTGQVGQDGVAGVAGSAGNYGEDGVSGQAGTSGEEGGNGTTGASGGEGDGGKNGKDGSDGSSGSSGVAGQNAGDSTVNSALPTVSVTEWNITATSLSGALLVSDTAGALIYSDESYPTLVTIYNVATNEAIYCYPADSNGDVDDINERYFTAGSNDSMDGLEWYFGTYGDPLDPDTEYRLSVTAYYMSNDEDSALVYSRELLSRTFYTDSTGIVLSYEEATTSSITINATQWDDFVTEGAKVYIYLMTQSQSDAYTINTEGGYTDMFYLDYSDDGNGVGCVYDDTGRLMGSFDLSSNTVTWTFDGLGADEDYIVRVVVENSSITQLSTQTLNVSTLKTAPTWSSTTGVTAVYNRTTGAFDVSVPTVTDINGGIESYTFTVYDEDGKVVTSKEILPERLGSASFYLASETYYNFGVTINFYDNEKTVIYDMGTSGYIQSLGDSMPTLTLIQSGTDSNNSWVGQLIVTLGSSTSAEISTSSPWVLTLWADQLFEESISITAEKQDVKDNASTDRYTVNGDYDEGTGTVTFNLNFDNLLNNTSYSIAVSGYIDLNDTNGTISRSLGTVTFRTTVNASLTATWTTNDSASLDRTVVLGFTPEEDLSEGDLVPTDDQKSNALADLKQGSVLIQLYRGTGNDKVAEDYRYIQDQTSLEALYGDGLTIDDNMFSVSASGSEAVSYSIAILDVADQTYAMEGDLGYVNYYEDVDNNVSNITVEPSPPDLLTDPTTGVVATPIYNSGANLYGKSVDPDLPSDAIVGYKLAANYDNGQRVGETITYYALEALSMQDTILTADPLQTEANEGYYLYSATHDISSSSDEVPNVVFFFGTDSNGLSGEANATYKNSCWVHYVGDAVETATSGTTWKLTSGMDRGYKYLFAYTATYKIGISSGYSYPYNMSDYEDYCTNYGIGKPFSTSTENYGKRVAYILNSGVVEAPKVAPTTHTYVASSTQNLVTTTAPSYTTGSVTVNFALEDPDSTVVWTATATDAVTTVTYQSGFGTYPSYSQANISGNKLTATAADGESWYSLTFPYQVDDTENMYAISPSMDIGWFNFDYESTSSAMYDWGWKLVTAREAILCEIPVEWAWGADLENQRTTAAQGASTANPLVTITPTVSDTENKITFGLAPVGTSGTSYLNYALARDYGLWVKLSPQDTSIEPFEIYLDIVADTDTLTEYKAELSLASISQIDDFLGESLTVEAEIHYDNGVQGWDLITEDSDTGYFALQKMVEDETWEMMVFEQYYTIDSWSSYTTNALLFQTTDPLLSEADLMDTITWKSSVMYHEQVEMLAKNTKSNTEKTLYLYPGTYGIDRSVTAGVESRAGIYVVPKGVGVHTFSISSTIRISALIPTVKSLGYDTSRSEIAIESLTLGNATYFSALTTKNKDVYLALYDNITDARYLNDVANKTIITLPVDPTTGVVTVDSASNIFSGLTEQTTYYVAIYYLDNSGNPTLFVIDGSSETSVYTITTQGDLSITSEQGLIYRNYSYFEKYFEIQVKLDRTKNITLAYDIFMSETQPLDTDTDVLIPRTDLYSLFLDSVTYDASGDIVGASSQSLKINLKPDAARSVFLPGNTYWLRVTAYEDGVESGIQYFSAYINPADSTTGIVKLSGVTSSAMTFTVTAADTSYSYMGHADSTGAGYGKYAVRFFVKSTGDSDDIGTWKRYATSYGEETYPMSTAQRTFTLDNLDPSTEYAIKVYAVYDEFHDGSSPPLRETTSLSIADGASYTAAQLFDSSTDSDGDGLFENDLFSQYLDTFWGSGNTPTLTADEMSDEDVKFCIGEKSQETASSSGILIDPDVVHVAKPYPTTMVLYLTEAYGIIQDDENGDAQQMITKMDISITGRYADGSSTNYSISKVAGDDDFTFVEGQDEAGFDAFYYTIPLELPTGQYSVTVSLYSGDAGSYVTELDARTYTTTG